MIRYSLTRYMRNIGLAVGQTMYERREELGYSLLEISQHLYHYWGRSPPRVGSIIRSIEHSPALNVSDEKIIPGNPKLPIERQISDYLEALEMPQRRRKLITLGLREINPEFNLPESTTESYSIYRKRTKGLLKKVGLGIKPKQPRHFAKLEGLSRLENLLNRN